jgi:integrase
MSLPSILPLHSSATAADGPPRDFSRATVRQILDWFRSNSPDQNNCASAEAERQRNRDEFGKLYGHLPVVECKPHNLLTFINARTALKSAWSRRRWAGAIQRPFNLAVQLGLIDRNPFKGVRWPAGDAGRDWTTDEYRAMLLVSPPDMRRVIVFLRFSGARPGELRALTRAAVLLDQRVIVLREHKTLRSTGRPRRIHLNSTLVKLLIWLARHNWGREYLFLNSHGRPWTRSAIDKRFRELREKAGLSEKVRPHGLRHLFACRAVMNGVDLATLALLLGHASTAMTERYVHLAGKSDHLNAAAEKAVKGGK